MIFFPFFAAAMLSATAYLQAEAAWWKGPLAAAVFMLAGTAIAMGLSEEAVANTMLPPVTGLIFGAWLCAAVVGLGSALALALRRSCSSGKIAGIAFLIGLIFFHILPFVI